MSHGPPGERGTPDAASPAETAEYLDRLLAEHLERVARDEEEEAASRSRDGNPAGTAPASGAVRILPGSATAPPAVPPPGYGDRDVQAVLAALTKLADGNGATKDDVSLVGGTAVTRRVRLRMSVGVGWGSTAKRLYGAVRVQGSTGCDGHASASAHLAQACGAACREPAVAAGIAGRMTKDPKGTFSAWADTHKLSDLPHAAHWWENCRDCSARGVVTCGNYTCKGGRTPCHHCNQTGNRPCDPCEGSGYTHDQHGRSRHCSQCGGLGRSGNCHVCFGSVTTACTTCGGRGTVRCGACNGHGVFTHVYRTYLEATVTRAVDFENDVPGGFRESCLLLPRPSLADGDGILKHVEVSPLPALVSAVLHCEVRHVHASVRVRNLAFEVDAIGIERSIPRMPAFLDRLLEAGDLTSPDDATARKAPLARLLDARKTRVTTALLRAVGAGESFDADRFARSWKGAVSAGFVGRIEGRLRSAYSRAARSSVRRVWLVAAPLIAAGVVVANAYHMPLRLFEAVWQQPRMASQTAALIAFMSAEVAVAVPLLLAGWLVAGHRARAALRAGVGTVARRRPGQGVWPWLGLLLALVSGWCAAAAHVEAASWSLPYAPVPIRVVAARPTAAPVPKPPAAGLSAPPAARDRARH